MESGILSLGIARIHRCLSSWFFFARHLKNVHFPLDTHTVITSFASCYTTLENHFLFLVYISYLEIKTKNIKTKNNSKFSLPNISHLTLKNPIILNNSLKGTQLSSVETRCMLLFFQLSKLCYVTSLNWINVYFWHTIKSAYSFFKHVMSVRPVL